MKKTFQLIFFAVMVVAAVVLHRSGWHPGLPAERLAFFSVMIQIGLIALVHRLLPAAIGVKGKSFFYLAVGASCALFAVPGGGLLLSFSVFGYLVVLSWVVLSASAGTAFLAAGVALLLEFVFLVDLEYGFLRPLPEEGARLLLTTLPAFFWNVLPAVVLPLLLLLFPKRRIVTSSLGAGSLGAKTPAPSLSTASTVSTVVVETSKPSSESKKVPSEAKAVAGGAAARDYEKRQKAAEEADLEGTLKEIVYFMRKNFKSHTAAGFLSNDGGRSFVLNSWFSKSEEIKEDAVVFPLQGIVGKAVPNQKGFMTGDLKNYGDRIEYYRRGEDINSIMISRIVNEENGRTVGLLSVDSMSRGAFSDVDKDLLNRFSKVAALLINSVAMSKVLVKYSKRNETTYEISKKLSQQVYPKDVLAVVLNQFNDVLPFDRLVFCDFMYSENMGRIRKVRGEGFTSASEGYKFTPKDSSSIYGKVFLDGKESLCVDLRGGPKYRFGADIREENVPSEVMVAPVKDDKGRVMAVIGLESNEGGVYSEMELTLLKTLAANTASAMGKARLFAKMEKQATIDGLTQIPNHRHFQDLMDLELARSTKTGKAVSLLLMDIDHFKNFNDTYGHQLGDIVLKMVAKAMKTAIRNVDHAARYGGEEFVVILVETPNEKVRVAAERVRKAIEAIRIPHEGKELQVTVSIGAATFPADTQHKMQMIEMSDQAMYYAKEHGRNQVAVYAEVKDEIV